jgi:hypothetical protein
VAVSPADVREVNQRTAYAQIHLLKRLYRHGPCLCPAVAAPPQLAVEPRRGLRAGVILAHLEQTVGATDATTHGATMPVP